MLTSASNSGLRDRDAHVDLRGEVEDRHRAGGARSRSVSAGDADVEPVERELAARRARARRRGCRASRSRGRRRRRRRQPSASSRSTSVEPMNPAPPVTSAFIARSALRSAGRTRAAMRAPARRSRPRRRSCRSRRDRVRLEHGVRHRRPSRSPRRRADAAPSCSTERIDARAALDDRARAEHRRRRRAHRGSTAAPSPISTGASSSRSASIVGVALHPDARRALRARRAPAAPPSAPASTSACACEVLLGRADVEPVAVGSHRVQAARLARASAGTSRARSRR